MKRLLSALLMGLLVCPVWADSAVQQDSNAGFLKLATATVTVSRSAVTDLMITEPSSTTAWLAANPSGQWILLPEQTRGFLINAIGGDMIIGHPDQIATGTNFVGVEIPSGTSFKWESRSAGQTAVKFRLYMKSAATGTATLAAWGQ
jgi:hypothetical protein